MITGQLKMAGTTVSRIFGASKISQLLATGGSPGLTLIPCQTFAGSACRLLYTKEALGLTGYENTRERTATQLGAMKDRFKTRMEQYLSADSKSLIFTEDLKNMLYLADTESDLSMVDKMMKKFVKQNEQMRFGSFVFGPVVMRMFYHLDKPDAAFAAIQDPELVAFFDQLTSYQIAMDILYNKKRYDDVIKLYDNLLTRPFFEGRYPKECLVMAIAALHKIGTKEAYAKAKTILKAATDANAPVMRKAVAYAADLALKNKDAAGCLEILSMAQNQSYVTMRNLKALCLLEMDRLEDILPILRSALEQDVSYGAQKRTQASFFAEVIAKIKAAVEKKSDKELQHEFDKVLKSLETGTTPDDSTLADFLERDIEDVKQRDGMNMGYNAGRTSFGGGSGSYGRYGGGQQSGGGYERQQGGLRQPRYADDGQQGARYGGGFRQNRSSFGQDTPSQSGRNDMFGQDEGGQQQSRGYGGSGGGFGSSGGYQRGGFQRRDNFSNQSRGEAAIVEDDDPNAAAGYRPRSNYQRNRGAGGDYGGSSSNADAGYRPRTGYQRNTGSARQGLQDLDD